MLTPLLGSNKASLRLVEKAFDPKRLIEPGPSSGVAKDGEHHHEGGAYLSEAGPGISRKRHEREGPRNAQKSMAAWVSAWFIKTHSMSLAF